MPAVHGAMVYACDAAAERMSSALAAIPDGTWVGEDADRLRRCRRRRGVPGPRDGHEARRPGRSRLQRHLAPGAHLHQRDPARREDDGRDRVQVPLRPARAGSRPGRCGAIDLVVPEGTVVSALPPDGAVLRLLGAEPGDRSRRCCARSRRGSARRRSRATGAAPTSTARSAPGRTERRGSRPRRCGGEIGAYGGNRHGDADTQMLSYQANGIGVAVESVESDVPVVVLRHEPVPGHGRAPATTGAAPRCSATRSGSLPPSTT